MPAEVVITELGPGRSLVTVNGKQVDAVRSVTVRKDQGAQVDVVTIEVNSSRTTVTPAPVQSALEELEDRDAELDARMAARQA